MNNFSSDINTICFYHEYEEYGCFSNWYQSKFEYAGKSFSSVEQYMMYHKVMLFRQYDLAERIMASDDPAVIKKLGQTRFRTFDAVLWDEVCYVVVKRGVRAKFMQNPDILDTLLSTGNKVLAEASLKDTKWGIGVSVDDADRYIVRKWTGKNLLGRILMEVRDELRAVSKRGISYVDAMDVDFAEWHMSAGELYRIPKFHDTIKVYADTLRGDRERECFYHQGPLQIWETAMRTNMGGGLPAIGFWELKQDIFDIVRLRTEI